MKHTITLSYEVEAESWDLALEQVLRAPFVHLTYCRVKPQGARLVHVAVSNVHQALGQLAQRANEP